MMIVKLKNLKEQKMCNKTRVYVTDCKIKRLFVDKVILKSQKRFKSDHHKVYTEEINKTALSSNLIKDYKHMIRLQHTHMEQMHLKYVKGKW